MPDNSVDSIVTDPPYGLSFMGKKWDYDVPSEDIWRECLRVLKPGGHLLAFAGTRTQHRMAVRIEDAGFEIRDMIAWVYATGFPKNLDIGKAIDKAAGAEREVLSEGKPVKRMIPGADQDKTGSWIKDNGREFTPTDTAPATDAARQWQGFGTALKPSLEPITVARKPLGEKTVAANVLAHGTGGINVDGCRISAEGEEFGNLPNRAWQTKDGLTYAESGHDHRNGSNAEAVEKLKKLGRWPANLIHDGSDEVVGLFPDAKSGGSGNDKIKVGGNCYGKYKDRKGGQQPPSSGSAARFFYCAKTSKKDREGSTHPTMKPTDLMRYLCRLVTPPKGIVLDPFMGSGSTGKAAMLEGFQFIGIERDAEYFEIATNRIAVATPRQLEMAT